MGVLEHFAWIIEQNWWQDAVLSAGNIFFSLTLIPMLRQPGKPPLLTCIPNAVASLAGAFVFGTLHLWVTAGSLAITGVQWFILAFKKSRQNTQPMRGFTEVLSCDPDDANLYKQRARV
jgi:hypothetical protein